jgi:thiosulfate/3-mercaptopyruvate sulfurtransferase
MSSQVLIDADWIAAHLDDPDVRVVEIDVSGAAYDDGHIPGAMLWNGYKDLRHPDYTSIDPDELNRLLSRTGETTVGYPDVAIYYGSWSEWGHLPDTPVET